MLKTDMTFTFFNLWIRYPSFIDKKILCYASPPPNVELSGGDWCHTVPPLLFAVRSNVGLCRDYPALHLPERVGFDYTLILTIPFILTLPHA